MASEKELEMRIEDSSVRLEIAIDMLRIKNAVLEKKFNQLMNYLNLELEDINDEPISLDEIPF